MTEARPIWRSLLFVPAHIDRYVEAAPRRDADAFILDLEDGVPPAQKPSARAALARAVRVVTGAGRDMLVRVNAEPRLREDDLCAAVIEGVTALMLPKVAQPEEVRSVAAAVTALETAHGLSAGSVQLVAQIEDIAALPQLDAIAASSPRLIGMAIGPEDFSVSAGMEPTPETLFAPCQQLVFACRRAGILPFGYPGSIASFADHAAFADIARRGHAMGFVGGCAVHPDQAAILSRIFTPTDEAVTWAKALLAAGAAATLDGLGAFAFEGKMVDAPVLRRAEETLRRHAAIRLRDDALPAGSRL